MTVLGAQPTYSQRPVWSGRCASIAHSRTPSDGYEPAPSACLVQPLRPLGGTLLSTSNDLLLSRLQCRLPQRPTCSRGPTKPLLQVPSGALTRQPKCTKKTMTPKERTSPDRSLSHLRPYAAHSRWCGHDNRITATMSIMKPLLRIFRILHYCSYRPSIWFGLAAKASRNVTRRLLPHRAAQNNRRLAAECRIANTWCAKRAVNKMQDLTHYLPFRFVPLNLPRKFPSQLQLANERFATCPVKFGGSSHMDLIYSLARAIEARRIVETGVAFGWSSLALLLAIQDHNDDSLLCSVDLPYLNEWTTEWVGAAVPQKLRSRWRLFRMADRQGLPRALRQSHPVDLAHYDSDKSPQGRLFGYGTMWQWLRTGGVLVSDDIGDNLAFKSFAEKVCRTPIVVRWNHKYQGILIK